MNEKEAIEKLNEILEEWQQILNIEDKVDREIEMSMYFEDMPFIEIQTVLQALKDKDNRIDELEKALVDEDLKYKEKIKQLNGGINKLMAKRRKWKNKYYNQKRKSKERKNKITETKKKINDIMSTCNGANLGDLQMLLNILEE